MQCKNLVQRSDTGRESDAVHTKERALRMRNHGRNEKTESCGSQQTTEDKNVWNSSCREYQTNAFFILPESFLNSMNICFIYT